MGLKSAGINFVATLPDVNLADVLREVEEDREIIHVPLCREEEGIGICAGAYLVGRKCAAIMQNGGFFNSNNAIVSTLLQYQIPLLLLIYYAGDIGDRTFSTTGSMTEPVLQALGIRYYIMRALRRNKTAAVAKRRLCGAMMKDFLPRASSTSPSSKINTGSSLISKPTRTWVEMKSLIDGKSDSTPQRLRRRPANRSPRG